MRKIFGIFSVLIVLAALGVSAWWLVGSQEVLTCTDADGLNFFNASYIYGMDLNGTNYTQYDYCHSNNVTVLEYGCYEGNSTYAALVAENCEFGCFNGACLQNQTGNFTI